MEWVYDDGGRKAARFKGETGDCAVRAIAIAAQLPYRQVYHDLHEWQEEYAWRWNDKEAKAMQSAKMMGRNLSPRNGVWITPFRKYLEDHLGWLWTPTMFVGKGCKTHLKADELPDGRIICNVSKHYVAVIDGVIHDISDCSRDETRCVYGYWQSLD